LCHTAAHVALVRGVDRVTWLDYDTVATETTFEAASLAAGTAIEAALSELCGPLDVITPYREESEADRKGRPPQNYRIEHPLKPKRPLLKRLLGRPERYYHPSVGFYEHMGAATVRAYVGEEVWRSYFKFAFDRNPWDRQVSFYHHRYRRNETPPPFAHFIKSDKRARINNYEIYSLGGEVAVDFVGRYERLDDDLRHALSQVGLKLDEPLPCAKTTFRKSAKPYRDYYDSDTRAIVGDWYAPEIALLDYVF
jgi:hypothetical protein